MIHSDWFFFIQILLTNIRLFSPLESCSIGAISAKMDVVRGTKVLNNGEEVQR